MATSYTVMFSQALLILAAVQPCWGEDQGSLYPKEATVVPSIMREVSHAMQCFADTSQEGLRLHKDNTDMILKIKEEMLSHKENENSLKRENEALNKVITLTEEILNLKLQLVSQDQKVDKLSQEISDIRHQLDNNKQNVITLTQENTALKTQLESKDKKVDNCSNENIALLELLKNKNRNVDSLSEEVQELKTILADNNKTLVELQTKQKEITKECEQNCELVKTPTPVNWTNTCEYQYIQEIKPKVMAFSNERDWKALRRDLDSLLDHSSEVYKQLQKAFSLFWVGYSGSIQLASLLICAGLPVHTSDNDGYNLLHGEARGGYLQLVKLLVDRGANINLKGWNDWTPVSLAAFGGHLDVVQWLVQAGADTTARNKDGRNALEWARSEGHGDVVQYLEQFLH